MKILFLILTLLSLRVSAADQVKTPKNELHYGLIISKGHHNEDFDVLISRKQDRLYSFKYCRSHDDKDQPTKVLEIRRKFLLGELEDSKQINQLVESLFASQDCKSIGADTYATFDTSKIWNCGRHTEFDGTESGFYMGMGVSAIASVIGGIFWLDRGSKANSIREVIFLSVLTGLATMEFGYIPHREKYFDNFSSVSFCQDGEKNLRLVESISDFKKSFQTGLRHAIKIGAFSEL